MVQWKDELTPGILCSIIVEGSLGEANIKLGSKGESIWKQNKSVYRTKRTRKVWYPGSEKNRIF